MTALSFIQLEEAYIMVYENAKELLEESQILFDNKRYARSYALAQISHEELGKLPIIYQEATRSHFKEPHDWKSFHQRLRSHESKNKQNYIFYLTMLTMKDNKNCSNIEYEKIKDNLKFVNHLKNVSLYSDVKNDKFTKPSLEIKKSLAKSQLELVEELFKTYSLTQFHLKGKILKSLQTEKVRFSRELIKKAGLIK